MDSVFVALLLAHSAEMSPSERVLVNVICCDQRRPPYLSTAK